MFGMTNRAITEDIGARLKSLRLQKNFRQVEIAENTGLSVKAVQNAEKGSSTLITYVKILRSLNALDALNSFIPEISEISPLELAKRKGRVRLRASRSSAT